VGVWGLGVWGLGFWAQPPIPNPQSPIPILIFFYAYNIYKLNIKYLIKLIKIILLNNNN
jgi:hypothetical protein